MDKEKAKEYYDYLNRKYTEWCTSKPRERSIIASEIHSTALRWDDEIYLHLMGSDNATGLFEHGFFESDIQRAFELLREIIDEGKSKSVDKLYMIYKLLEDYDTPKEDVVRKELRDYLLEKIHNGDLKDKKITFKDSEDFEYFSKLTGTIGINANELLEDIVMKAFGAPVL